MRKISPEELESLQTNSISKNEWLSLSPTYCVICKKFIVHTWDAWGNPQPAFSADIKVGGWYCSRHTPEELKSAQHSMHADLLRTSSNSAVGHPSTDSTAPKDLPIKSATSG